MGTYLFLSAQAAARTKDTYLAAQYHRIAPRRGHRKALGALEHTILVAGYHMLKNDRPYQDLGPDHFARHNQPERRARRLVKELAAIGYDVTLPPRAA